MKDLLFRFLLSTPVSTFYNDDPPTPDPKQDDDNDDLPPSAKGKTTFTQDEFNRALAEDRKKHTARFEKQKAETDRQIKTLEQLQKSKSLTEKEKQSLEQQIDTLKNSQLTEKELAAKEQEKLRKQHGETVQVLTSERDLWQGRFNKMGISNTIISEGAKAEAFDNDALIAILGPHASMVEDTDGDGKGLGSFNPKVKFADTDKDGKPVTLELTVEQAVKRMKEMPKYGYLFKSTASGGLGGTPPVGKGGKIDPAKLSPEQYREWRKTQGLGRNKTN